MQGLVHFLSQCQKTNLYLYHPPFFQQINLVTLLDILENSLQRYDILNYNILCKYEDFQIIDLRYLIHLDLKKILYQLDWLRLKEVF